MNVVLWDTRSPKSALKLTTITPRAAVHLLKWNRKQTNLMATASNGEIRIWDIRKEKSALTHITAHMGKINAIDWSYNSENELLTAGQDATVKCWDTANPRKEKATIQAGLPVALASYTPFGGGVVTVAQRDDFCPRLWSLADTSAPIHSFSGENAHADIVTAVEWRTSTKHGEKKYQLVSWSKDQHLKFWKIDQPIFDCLSGRGPSEGDLFSMPGTPVNSLGVPSPRGHRSSPRDEQRVGLTQEFALMRQNPIRGITIKTLDAAQAYCEATARVGSYMQELKITFPSAYPHSAPPSFHLPPNGTITTRTRNKLKEVLSNAADRYVSVSRPCLEPCLSELISSLEAEAAKNSDLQTPSSSSGLLGLGFEGLGIDSIMGMGPLGMGLGVSSGLAGSGGDDHSPLDRFDATAAGSSGLQVGSIDGSNPFGLLTQSSAAKRHGADTSGDRGSGGHKRLATATAGLKASASGGGAAVDKLSGSDARVDDHGKRSVDRDHATSGASGREKGMTTTGGGGGGAMGGIGRTSSGGNRTRSFSAADTGLTSVSASALLSPTSMSPSSPAVASPSSYYLSSRDESIPAPRTCGVCFGVDGLVEFRSFAGGDSSTQALTASRTYADLRRQLSSRETPSGGMNKNAFVEITKLYFYEEVVDLLPIKMDLSSHGKGAGGQGKGQGSNVLVMRDITALLPISRELAIEYTLTGLSAHELCAKNCLAAKKVGRKDLVQLWTLVGQLTHDSLYQPSEEGTNGTMTSPKGTKGAMTADDCPWSYHPFGRSLVASLFRYYQSLGDIQTLAMLACVLSFSPNVVAPSPAPARAMITVQPATSSVASTSTSSFFPSIFRRDQVSSSASADEVPVSTSGGKPHRDLKRELSLGNEVFGGKLKNLKRERVNSSSFISQPSVQSSTGSLSFSNIDSLTSASALSTSPGDSSPPPPPPPPSASMRHYHHDRIAQSGASLTSASSPTLQGTSLTSSVGQLEPLILNSGVGGGDVSTSGGGSSSMLSTASSRLSVGYGRTSSTPNALLSTSPSSPSHMRDAAAREHKRSQSLTSKKAAESRRTGPQVENLNSLLDPSKQPLYEHYKRSYGEVLYRWGLLEKRAEVLKLLQTSTKQQSRMCIGLSLACHNCGQPVTGPSPLCTACRMAAFRCALCHTPVRGLSNFCLVCGHGGHMHHMRQWFEKQSFCPSGCGCPCLTHTPSLIS